MRATAGSRISLWACFYANYGFYLAKKRQTTLRKMLDPVREFRQKRSMKQLIRLTILFCACAALAITVVAGPEPLPSGKEMKEVAPAPLPECNWSGFYIGLNVGGNFGHAENTDV